MRQTPQPPDPAGLPTREATDRFEIDDLSPDPAGLPTREETDRFEVADRSPDITESAEAIGWKEAKLTLATLVFFGVPLLIASAQIAANYHLSREFQKQAENSYIELFMLHWGAVIVTGIGLISAILIVATSLVRVGANFLRTWKEIRRKPD